MTQKTILITGATDGIGLEAAKRLAAHGHNLLLHGRSLEKMNHAKTMVVAVDGSAQVDTFLADMTRMSDVEALAQKVTEHYPQLDALINNAGVFNTPVRVSDEGLDVRFAVNTIAPYLLTKRLLPLLGSAGRVVNVSSAAQAPVDLRALAGEVELDDMGAYAQSKLAITMWSRSLALSLGKKGPVIVAVNPASLLGSKMVKEAFGVDGKDLGIGADILIRAAIADDFADASGKYFDNDAGQFGTPHADALDSKKSDEVVRAIEEILAS